MAADKSVNKKIGIMGGTFDPVHAGHLIIAEKAREEFGLEKVLFIPSGTPPHKRKVFASSRHRFAMVEIAIEGNRYFAVSDIEVKRKNPSYTYDTVSLIKRMYPEMEMYFITGEDALSEIKTWHRYEELIKETVFLVAPREKRPSAGIPRMPFFEYRFIEMPLLGMSSSYIRDCISTGKTVKYLLPDRVLEYIRKYSLYRDT